MENGERTYHDKPSRPLLTLPAGACDSHCHVFGPTGTFPYAEDARFRPGEAPKEKLFALHDLLGIQRCVVVQSGCHGYDNRAIEDVVASRPGRYLGIALVPLTISHAEIARLAGSGIRGARFNFMPHLQKGADPDELMDFSTRIQAHGWHLQLHVHADLIEEMTPLLKKLPVDVVIDHMGRIDATGGIQQPAFQALLRLLDHEHVRVKVSGCERSSTQGPPWVDAVPLARNLVERFSDRVLWGTDWPHPNLGTEPPDDGRLVELIGEIAPTSALRQALLVDNPMSFYRFEA
ncbi:amidohydrolase family protein [Salinicola sp. MIT1003]|uniref:amidohydrolase family protein n=1 Tax=Salinicola sp. MIT1003 TaxID=1882734 RepID=UPI0008DCC1F1|nr:amidohydrolase family protein [Salinicola sp. MIT1003]OHZ02705.1 amidohydrolase [Salinicola sp. MIT1003]